jgi:hypothetical protein
MDGAPMLAKHFQKRPILEIFQEIYEYSEIFSSIQEFEEFLRIYGVFRNFREYHKHLCC